MQTINLIWFRRDLRLDDNWMLNVATKDNQLCLPLFIIDPFFYQSWSEVGNMRVRFLFESLEVLCVEIKKVGGQLVLFEGDSLKVIQSLSHSFLENGLLPSLYFHRDRQINYGQTRDQNIVHFYQDQKLKTYIGNNNFLVTSQQDMPTWRKRYYDYQKQTLYPKPREINFFKLQSINKIFKIPGLKIVSLEDLKQKYSKFYQTKSTLFTGGFLVAKQKLKSFVDDRFVGYHWKLSRPFLALKGSTSQLSPHIMWGTISVREVNKLVYQKVCFFKETGQKKLEFSLKAFLDRLRWRESFTQRLYFNPRYATENWYSDFDQIYSWDLNPQQLEFFEKWKQGQTGFPLVDASMRQLKELGWINFRMRAMVATFLTINCGVSWQWGARHFMNCLVDGDVAINHWQWQMQAGITNPLAKTFRIYNPSKNLQTQDSKLDFVHRFIPELADLNLKQILSVSYLNKTNYAKQMLDFEATRRQNGKIIADLRHKVRQRISKKHGLELEEAKTQIAVVKKYYQSKQQKYQKMLNHSQDLFET